MADDLMENNIYTGHKIKVFGKHCLWYSVCTWHTLFTVSRFEPFSVPVALIIR